MLGMKNHFDVSGSIEIGEVDIAGVSCIYFGSHNGPLTQSMHHSEKTNIKINHYEIKKSILGVSYKHCQ